ncbi:MAG: dual specificity protein phosphatase family protein [Anaerolineae bacterium]|nr:dual specificity protein phosphatase family protein [Anaerolineae bacterium]
MHQIRDWLTISNYGLASNEDYIRKEGFGAMLQLHRPIVLPGIETLYLAMRDGEAIAHTDIASAVTFVQDHHTAGEKVLITCGAGVSRSVTMAIAALKAIEGGDLETIYRDVRVHHPEALPDQVHWDSICAYFGETVSFWELWSRIMLEG